MNPNQLVDYVVINSKRKTFGQGAMIAVNDLVNPCEKKQGINI
jgi:hypothetical protein